MLFGQFGQLFVGLLDVLQPVPQMQLQLVFLDTCLLKPATQRLGGRFQALTLGFQMLKPGPQGRGRRGGVLFIPGRLR